MSRKPITCFRRIAVTLLLFLFFGFAILEYAAATVKPPVHVELMTGWRAEKGGPLVQVAEKDEVITVIIAISSDIDVETADFELILPEGWEYINGRKNWSGSLFAGEEFTMDAVVRVTSDNFGILRGEIFMPEFGTATEGWLDLRDPKNTDRIAEWGQTGPVPRDVPTIMMEDMVDETALKPLLPEPYVEPLDRESDIKQLGAGDDDVRDSCSVRAQGQLVYLDDHGSYIGISGARVILWDSDDDADDECGRGVTDWNGNFDVSGSCGDPWNPFDDTEPPDIYIQIYAVNTNYVQVGSPYTAVNPTISNFCGTHNYGSRAVPSGHRGAYQLFNQAVQANMYIDQYDSKPPMVRVNWPASGSGAWYSGGQIYITDTTPWFEPTLYHEYGHFVMDEYADLPTFNYCNGICDASATDCGHCLWAPENGYIHWMEGWPDFFADLQSDYWNRDDFYDFETHTSGADSYPVNQRDEIEGITAAILWDIYDSTADNQHGDNPRDNLSLGFDEIWNVSTNYDPGGTYDYPMTIHQFWNGFYGWYAGHRQGLWSVYAEHHINKDTTAPGNPTSVSSSHSPGVWSSDRTISFSWSGAIDNLSGVHGYSYLHNTSPSTIPNTSVNTTGTTYTTPSLGDGSNHYFHIRTQDKAGNWNSGAVHRGPYYIDGTAPSGLISINSGAAYTNSRTVTLNLSASDATSGLSQMRVGNYGDPWGAWESYKTSKTWTLKDIDGTRRVYVQYRDRAGNVSLQYYDEIRLDRTAPTGSIVINSGAVYTGSRSVTLALSASDAISGVSQMRVGNYLEPWGAWESYKTSKTWTLKDIDGTRRVYVQYRDGAGNISAQYFDEIRLDRTAPTGSIVINSGAAYTGSRSVTLALSASDAVSGVSQMRVGNAGDPYGAWESYQTSKAWALKDIDGTRRVYVQYRDGAGNTSLQYYDEITLDRTAPTGSIVINDGAAYTGTTAVSLKLSASDSASGVYRMRFSNNGCTWSGWQSYATNKSWTLGSGDGIKTVYVQFQDNAGNVSTSYSDTIELDTTGPGGSIQINAGDAWTDSLMVTLDLSATDAAALESSVASMRFSNDGSTWCPWEVYSSTRADWDLSAYGGSPAAGIKTVFAQFMDSVGNTSGIYSDDIELIGAESFGISPGVLMILLGD